MESVTLPGRRFDGDPCCMKWGSIKGKERKEKRESWTTLFCILFFYFMIDGYYEGTESQEGKRDPCYVKRFTSSGLFKC